MDSLKEALFKKTLHYGQFARLMSECLCDTGEKLALYSYYNIKQRVLLDFIDENKLFDEFDEWQKNNDYKIDMPFDKELLQSFNKLPPDKQIYVSGYVQGIADSMADKETKESA